MKLSSCVIMSLLLCLLRRSAGTLAATVLSASGSAAVNRSNAGNNTASALADLRSSLPRENASSSDNVADVTHVRLRKQSVPTLKDGKVVAYKSAYFGRVYVGSPQAQVFDVVFDTGSGHVILPLSSCTSEACLKSRRYDGSASTSFVDIEYDGTPIPAGQDERDEVEISFGSGNVLGELGQDRLCLDKTQQDCVDLRMVLATEMTVDPFALFDFDGVVGLSLSSLALNEHFSFLFQRQLQHPALSPQFAVFLSNSDDDDNMISFGGYDKSRTTSEPSWSPVAREDLGYWQVQIKSVSAGGRLLMDCANESCYAILDTGTSLLGVPRDLTKSFHRGLTREVAEGSNPGAEDIDCRGVPGPNLEFDLGDHVVSLGVEDYSKPAAYKMSVPGQDGSASERTFCRPTLLPVDMPGPLGSRVFIWGEPVLRRYYTVYDFGKKRIGFSRTTHSRISSGEVAHGGSKAAAGPAGGTPRSPSYVI